MKRSILCFLRNPAALADLQTVREGWEITIVRSREEAFEALAAGRFETVVIDAREQCEVEKEFLTAVANRCPALARILLFHPTDKAAHSRGSGLADQYVPQPCTMETLVAAAARAKLMHHWLANPALTRLLPRLRKLPSVPDVYLQVMEAIQSPDADLEEIGRIMSKDLVMTAKLLQIINSSFFALPRAITNPAEAVAHLGLAQTKALVLLASVFCNYTEDKSSGFSLDQLWRHSLGTAEMARRITQFETKNVLMADEAFIAGMLHDVGKLFYAVNCPEEFHGLMMLTESNGATYLETEQQMLGTTHAELGAFVLATWGLPAAILEGIAFHHTPSRHPGERFCPLTAVHVANVLDHEANSGSASVHGSQLDNPYLARVGCENRLAAWKDLAVAA